MKLNVKKPVVAVPATPVKSAADAMLELRRAVATCLLWEDGFYESGETLAKRLQRLVPLCPYPFVAEVAVEAREVHQLRHAPLLLLRELARHPGRYAAEPSLKELIPRVCTRADQLAELVALYWATNDGKKSLPAQVKKGLAAAFANFGAYALAKNDHQAAAVKLRDVAFLSHPKAAKPATLPDGVEPVQEFKDRTYKKDGAVVGRNMLLVRHRGDTLDQLCEGKLPTPSTWETKLSAAKTPLERQLAWSNLLEADELGGLAWLRNLRNMVEKDGLDRVHVLRYGERLAARGKLKGVLPFQFMTAARYCPWAADALQPLLLGACEGLPRLPGRTLVLVDVSGSMLGKLGERNEAKPTDGKLGRMDGAFGIAMFAREVCERADFFTFSDRVVAVSSLGPRERRGFTLAEALRRSQPHKATYMRMAVETVNKEVKTYDRMLVVTDEQSTDGALPELRNEARGYVMNVGTDEKGVGGTEQWKTISGWAPAVLGYVAAYEGLA